MNPSALWVRILCGVGGVILLTVVLDAALRTFLLPRVAKVRLSVVVAGTVSALFRVVASPRRSYAFRDRVLSLYASVVLLSYQATWLLLTWVAFALELVAAGYAHWEGAFEISGSSLLTLGTRSGVGGVQRFLEIVEAAVGLTLLALLIAFIPTLYAAFQRREFSVTRLSVRAGIPATPWGVLEIAQSVQSYERLDELWREWEQWFIEVGETHTTLTILNFYRSPSPDQTWIQAAATVLDAAALFNAAVDFPPSPAAGLCIRSGWLTLRRLADYFQISYPAPLAATTAPISITRSEFEHVLDHLSRSGVPLVANRDAAWEDFRGWRVNYDAIIEACFELFSCPRLEWSLAEKDPLLGPSNVRSVGR